MSYEDFVGNVFSVIIPMRQSGLREGQALMNYLFNIWPKEYTRISSGYYEDTNIDCFYKNEYFSNTMAHLEKVWNEEEITKN